MKTLTQNWHFKENEKDEKELAEVIAKVAQKNGLNSNDMQHLFPAVLRMIGSNVEWSKI